MVGRKFKFKLLESTNARTVTEVRNGFVVFDDGSRIEEQRLNDLFDEVGSVSTPKVATPKVATPQAVTPQVATPTPQVATTQAVVVVDESQNVQSSMNQDVVDPDSFFEGDRTKQYITQQVSNLKMDRVSEQGTSYTGAKVIEKPVSKDVEGNVNDVRRYEAQRDDFTEEDRKYAGYSPQQNEQFSSTSDVSTVSFFKNLKRVHKVKLSVEIEENIPKPDFIKMMDENFDGGVLNFLVTDIVSTFLKKPQLLEKYIRDSLEEIVY
ncbi:MAG: hypothetical protein ACC656_04815, partial [Candidatus Heimdallarchaeota archaeon]